jgi:hypothetical protein
LGHGSSSLWNFSKQPAFLWSPIRCRRCSREGSRPSADIVRTANLGVKLPFDDPPRIASHKDILGFWSTSELADLQVNPDRTAIAHEHAVIAAMEPGGPIPTEAFHAVG